MTILFYLLWLFLLVLLLLLFIVPLLTVGIIIYLSVKHRQGLVKSFNLFATRLLAWEQRIWYNAIKINQEKNYERQQKKKNGKQNHDGKTNADFYKAKKENQLQKNEDNEQKNKQGQKQAELHLEIFCLSHNACYVLTYNALF